MGTRTIDRLAFVLALLSSRLALTQTEVPLDVSDPTSRAIIVHVEESSDLSTVGQNFGVSVAATYSASGNVGTLIIPPESHEQLAATGFTPVPGSFTSIVIEIDLTTLEATSQPASGAAASGPISESFTQGVLDTTTLGGFMGPSTPPLFCTSQAEVDNLCQIVSSFCGQTCTIVPGAPYDPATGLVNLIGVESVSGCDGSSMCSGPFDYFAKRGDLKLTEDPPAATAAGDSHSGPCVIATAAYGTPMAAQLDELRAFRDTWLLNNPVGAAFTDTYYRLSPSTANRIAGDEVMRGAVRCVLAPVVWLVGALN